MARGADGSFLLRIEDIDQARARPEWEALILDDLAWLGLRWDKSIVRQSERLPVYRAALGDLWTRGLLYPCNCNRKDIAAAAAAPQEGAPLLGPDGIVYPGTCRSKPRTGALPAHAVLRLDMAAALEAVGVSDADRPNDALTFVELGRGPSNETGPIRRSALQMVDQIGDIVLARRGMGTSYHLAVTLDDAAQDITHVVRGQDLFDATPIHVLLHRLFDLPTPFYHHHRLIRDAAGKRLAKRDDARAIRTYRADGATPDDVRRMIGL